MKTKYYFLDNFIQVSVVSDSGSMIHAVCYISLQGEGSMRVVDSFDIRNYSLTPVKFSFFCRKMVNSKLEYFYEHLDGFLEPDPELDFELR